MNGEVGQRQWEHRVLALFADIQSGPAGDKNLKPWALESQLTNMRRCVQHLFEIVEHEEHRSGAKEARYQVDRSAVSTLLQRQRLGDRCDDLFRCPSRRQ